MTNERSEIPMNLMNFVVRHRLKVLWIFLFLNVFVHIPMLDLPPSGAHVWRQIVGHTAARNYYAEDNRFFYPRADIRVNQNDEGIVYHELPLTYWLAAQGFQFFGEQNWISRVIPFAFNLLLIFGAYLFARSLRQSQSTAILFSYFISFSPLYLYYAPSMEPNILGLTFFISGLGIIIPRILDQKFDSLYAIGLFFIVLGTLCKPAYLFYGLPLAFVYIYSYFYKREVKLLFAALISGFFVLISNYLVLKHAKELLALSPNIRAERTPLGPAETPQSFLDIWNNFYPALSKWIVEMFISHTALIFFIVGIFLFIRKTERERNFQKQFIFWWIISFIIFTFLFIMRFADHDYYLTAILPLTALASAIGAERMLQNQNKGYRYLALFLIIILPIMNTLRVSGRWFKDKQVPELLLQNPEQLTAPIPKNDLVLIVGDSTPVVYLYFLNRKGIVLPEVYSENLNDVNFQDFHWLIQNESGAAIPQYITELFELNLVKKIDQFALYKIRKI